MEGIAVGADYSLLLTTSSGLCRYAIGDRVRVSGRIARTPTLRFLGRSGVTSDLCGEKLDEAFVARALSTLALGFGLLVAQVRPMRSLAPLAAWIDHGMRRAQRLGDIKLPALEAREAGLAIFRPAP